MNGGISEIAIGHLTGKMRRDAERTARYLRIMSLVGTVCGATLLLAALAVVTYLVSVATAEGRPTASIISMGGAQTTLAVLTLVSSFILFRAAQHLRTAARTKRPIALADAAAYEGGYWWIGAAWVLIGVASAVLAGTGPIYRAAVARLQVHRTAEALRVIGRGLDKYAFEHHAYPRVKSYEELKRTLEPKYIDWMPRKDAWDRPFDYWPLCERDLCGEYRLASPGADGRYFIPPTKLRETEQQRMLKEPLTGIPVDDLVYGNGYLFTLPSRWRPKP